MALPQTAGEDRPLSADRVPTLTEVVELGPAPALESAERAEQRGTAVPDVAAVVLPASVPAEPAEAAVPDVPGAALQRSAAAAIADSAALIDRVLAAAAPRIDEVVDTWLHEALQPALARAVDALVLDARQTLAGALRDSVAEAAEQTLAAARPASGEPAG